MHSAPLTSPKEATMRSTTTIARPGTARWLSANGHPGYGTEFARKVWAVLADQYDEHHMATCSGPEWSAMVWGAVRWVRNGWAIPTAVTA